MVVINGINVPYVSDWHRCQNRKEVNGVNKKAKIWCLGIVSLMILLTVGSAVATDEIIGVWFNYQNNIFRICYGRATSNYIFCCYTSDVITNSSSVDITAGDISGGVPGRKEDIVSCWPTGLWIYNTEALSWKRVNPYAPRRVAAGNLGQDEELEIIAAYGTGIYFFYPGGSGWSWRRITPYVPTGDIAAGDIDGDGLDEVVAGFSTGTWYWNPAYDRWTKITPYKAYNLAVGDRNGDGLGEVVGAFPSGIWSCDRGKWTRLTGSGFATKGDIAFGDFDGNGKDDLVSCWPTTNEIWILYDNGKWWKWDQWRGAADRVCTGDILLEY
jgi:hypothetical protein